MMASPENHRLISPGPTTGSLNRRLDPSDTPRVSSEVLFKNQSCLIIEHNGEEYVLRITRSGKLILTK